MKIYHYKKSFRGFYFNQFHNKISEPRYLLSSEPLVQRHIAYPIFITNLCANTQLSSQRKKLPPVLLTKEINYPEFLPTTRSYCLTKANFLFYLKHFRNIQMQNVKKCYFWSTRKPRKKVLFRFRS